MKYKLRYYQEDSILSTFKYINSGGKSGIAVLPTATGKSIVIADMIRRILESKNHVRVMMLTHVKELIEQNFEKIKSIWPTCPAGIYSAGVGFKQYSHPIIYGGIQSCYRKPKIFGHIDLIIVDEAHLISEKAESMYGSFINELRKVNPDLVVIGLTATPYRLNMGLLTEGPIFDDIYYDISTMNDFVKLIDEGFISDLVPVKTESQIDTDAIKTVGGEFQEKSLDDNVNRDELTKEIVIETIRRTSERSKGLAFCVSKSHAENMAHRFNEQNVKADFIHSGLTKTEREDRLRAYAEGRIQLLTNVGVLTTGFDAPDIDYLVVARPTQSTSLHVQIMGRGMRVHPSKENTLVLDFAGNCLRLGPINDPVLPVKKGEARGEAPIRICDQCGTINHAAAKECKTCGFLFPPPKPKIENKPVQADIIRRQDVPRFKDQKVDAVIVNKHKSFKGNLTVKLTFQCGSYFYDTYYMFDKSNKGSYIKCLKRIKQLKFDTDDIEIHDNDQAYELLKNNLIKPDKIKVWMNKPVQGKTKKQREIVDYIYEE